MKGWVIVLAVMGVASCRSRDFAGTERLTLARSTSTSPAPSAKDYDGRVVVYSAAKGLSMDGVTVISTPASSTGFPKEMKKAGSGLTLLPLQASLQAKKIERVLLAFEATTPYRAVVEVVYTLAESGASHYELLVDGGERRSVLPLDAPRSGGNACVAFELHRLFDEGDAGPKKALTERDALCVGIVVRSNGVDVQSRGDRLDETCLALTDGEGPTLDASKVAPVDAVRLTRCLNALKAAHPHKTTTPVAVSAQHETAFRDVVTVLDALRSTGFTPTLGTSRGLGSPTR